MKKHTQSGVLSGIATLLFGAEKIYWLQGNQSVVK
jgi:hypothetical protein